MESCLKYCKSSKEKYHSLSILSGNPPLDWLLFLEWYRAATLGFPLPSALY